MVVNPKEPLYEKIDLTA